MTALPACKQQHVGKPVGLGPREAAPRIASCAHSTWRQACLLVAHRHPKYSTACLLWVLTCAWGLVACPTASGMRAALWTLCVLTCPRSGPVLPLLAMQAAQFPGFAHIRRQTARDAAGVPGALRHPTRPHAYALAGVAAQVSSFTHPDAYKTRCCRHA